MEGREGEMSVGAYDVPICPISVDFGPSRKRRPDNPRQLGLLSKVSEWT